MKSRKRTVGRDGPAKSLADSGAREHLRRKCRVAVIEDHPMTRAGLVAFIDGQSDLEVCLEAGDPAQALSRMTEVAPDLIVTDLSMPGRSGIEFIRDLHAMNPAVPILVLSMHDEMVYAERAMKAGASGYLMKQAGGDKIIRTARLLLAGGVQPAPRKSPARRDGSSVAAAPGEVAAPEEQLSGREFEIFGLIGEGRTVKEIADILRLSPKTVDVHRGHIKEKLGLMDATSLVRYAVLWLQTHAGPPQ